MKIGDLDTRVELWTQSATTDSFGQAVKTFSKNATVWAKRFDRGAGESVVNDRVVSIVRTEFTIRHKGNVDETVRVKYDGDFYRIEGVLSIGRKRFMRLICTRRDD